jgi:hypothetical protein
MRKQIIGIAVILCFFSLETGVYGSTGKPFASQSAIQLANRFLPKRANIELLSKYDPITKTETNKPAVAFGRLMGHPHGYLAFIYSGISRQDEEKHLILRVILYPESKATILDQTLPGTYLWMQDYVTNGFELMDLNGDGDDDIVTISAFGASVGAEFSIFALKNEDLIRIFSAGGHRFNFDRLSGGEIRLVIYGKWSDASNSTIDVYAWNGDTFVRLDNDFFEYYEPELKKITNEILKVTPKSATGREYLTRQAVGIFMKHHKYNEAIELCKRVLPLIEDPSLDVLPPSAIKPGMSKEEHRQIENFVEISRIQSRADVHRFLRDVYEASGDLGKAQEESEAAQALDTEAKKMESKSRR